MFFLCNYMYITMNWLFYLHVIIICRKLWYIILYLYVYIYTYSPTIALLSAQLEGHKDIRPTCFGHFGPNSLHMFAVSSAPTCWRSMAPDSVSLPLFPSVLTTGTCLFWHLKRDASTNLSFSSEKHMLTRTSHLKNNIFCLQRHFLQIHQSRHLLNINVHHLSVCPAASTL